MAIDRDTSGASQSWWKRARNRCVGFVFILYLAAIVFLTAYEGKLIFLPPTNVPAETPADEGLNFEDLKIPVEGPTYVHAWWIPSTVPNAKTILYFHGNAGVLEHEAQQEAGQFHHSGANLLLVDYRGYGHSSPMQTSGATAREDALASLRYLEHVRHIPASNIVIFGWSIGTGVATQLALDAPDAGGLILLSPITSVDDVANQNWMFRYFLRPSQWLRHVNDFDNKAKISSIHMPVLIMTGTDDTIAPPWMAEELYARANEPKHIQLIEGAEHNDVMDPKNRVFQREFEWFLGTLSIQGSDR